MANKATQPLRDDHKAVLKKLLDMERLIGALDRPETEAPLRELAAFFQTEFWVHFSKEETALFPEMEKHIPREGGPIGVMLGEHEDLRRINGEFQAALERYPGDPDATPTIYRHGLSFINLLRNHIDKEDNILFMFAENLLTPEQAEAVAAAYPRVAVKPVA